MSHSGTSVSLTSDVDAQFPLPTGWMLAKCKQLSCFFIHTLLMRPVGLTCSQLDGPDGSSQMAELRSVQLQPLWRTHIGPEGRNSEEGTCYFFLFLNVFFCLFVLVLFRRRVVLKLLIRQSYLWHLRWQRAANRSYFFLVRSDLESVEPVCVINTLSLVAHLYNSACFPDLVWLRWHRLISHW